MQKHEPQLMDKLVITIGLICGWTYTHHSLKAISEYADVPFEKLEEVSYRGDGPVGKLVLKTTDGQEAQVSRRVNLKYQAAFDRTYNLKRCHYCVNHQNFLADLVVGDAWLPSTVFTKTGISLVIARTPKVKASILAMQDEQRLRLLEVTENEVIESQKPRIVYGNFSYPYADYVRSQGEFAPELVGPNNNKTRPVSHESLAEFHEMFNRKVRLQREGKYRYLLRLKLTKELPNLFHRYWEWFTVRILRIKSIKGERQEIPREKLAHFE